MDIKQLKYFTEIIRCNFNLSIASKELHISQPGLSYMIKNFENTEGICIFEKSNGKFIGLTQTGEEFYENALVLLNNYSNMMIDLRRDSRILKGKIKIGIPPLILDIIFYNLITQLIIENPDIEFIIVEKGAYELRKMLILKELDFAILLTPTRIDKMIVTEYILQDDNLSLFLNIKNPLATNSNKKIKWSKLNGKFLSIFDESFMINHKLIKKFEKEKVYPKRVILSKSWYFLLMTTFNSNFVTILPTPIENFFENSQIVKKEFENPILWQIVLCQVNKKKYSLVSKYVLNFILKFFNKL